MTADTRSKHESAKLADQIGISPDDRPTSSCLDLRSGLWVGRFAGLEGRSAGTGPRGLMLWEDRFVSLTEKPSSGGRNYFIGCSKYVKPTPTFYFTSVRNLVLENYL
ncbi:piggyBac transposable element-derived protein 4 [Biomphalaria glabrata]|nr:Biomphalaria glabrata piggyBac transposable element-derived protein 4-like [Biomphalaria glabrata]